MQVIAHFFQVLGFLLPTWYGELGGFLFDDGQKDMGLDVTVN